MMARLALAALFALASTGAFAQQTTEDPPVFRPPGPPAPSLIACGYNAQGAYTGADGANPGEQAGPVKPDGYGGYRLVIEAPDGRSCPPQVQTGG